MSRNDSVLYTGASSASFGAPKEQLGRSLKREEKLEKRIKLSPVSTLVMEELEKEIKLLGSLDFTAVNELIKSGIPHALEIDLLSNEKTIERLKSVKVRLANILREAKK